MTNTVTIYITKDAPTKGIRRAEATFDEQGRAAVVIARSTLGQRTTWFQLGEFAVGLEEAERRRDAIIATLSRQIAALREMDMTQAAEFSDA